MILWTQFHDEAGACVLLAGDVVLTWLTSGAAFQWHPFETGRFAYRTDRTGD